MSLLNSNMSENKKQIISENVDVFAERGFLLNPEFFSGLLKLDSEDIKKIFLGLNSDILVVNEDLVGSVRLEKLKELNWVNFDQARVELEKKGEGENYNAFLDILYGESRNSDAVDESSVVLEDDVKNTEELSFENGKSENGRVIVLKSFSEKCRKVCVEDFVEHMRDRYKNLKEILSGRIELREAVSINRILGKSNERVSVIGIVNNKRITKNDNVLVEIEDSSGIVNVLINKNRFELKEISKEIVFDEVLGVVGNINNGFLFADKLFFPDVPLTKELKKSPYDEEAVFISDIHVGGKDFLREDFLKFIEWIKEKENVKYLFIIGDLIEGVGIYPGQEEELEIKDYREQYSEFIELMGSIPERIKIIFCPGNHDALRLDEPQPAIGKELIGDYLERENIYSVSNPAVVNIGATEEFPGFDVLLYHGGSFPYYASEVESIRLNGAMHRPDLIMKFLLKKRHLAPTHTSTSYVASKNDHLVIDKVPDFFVSGHIHRCSVGVYNNVTLLNCGCWFPQSDYQEKRGLEPEPSRAIIVNLKTRETQIKFFGEIQ